MIAVLNRKNRRMTVEDIRFRRIRKRKDAALLAGEIWRDYGKRAVIAIDSPRRLSPGPKCGRQCEREIKKEGLANPQWSPTRTEIGEARYEWMRVGFDLFRAFDSYYGRNVIEVFPTASYKVLKDPGIRVDLPFSHITKKNGQDVLDAVCAAITAYYWDNGSSRSFGEGDKHGEIIVPGE